MNILSEQIILQKEIFDKSIEVWTMVINVARYITIIMYDSL